MRKALKVSGWTVVGLVVAAAAVVAAIVMATNVNGYVADPE